MTTANGYQNAPATLLRAVRCACCGTIHRAIVVIPAKEAA